MPSPERPEAARRFGQWLRGGHCHGPATAPDGSHVPAPQHAEAAWWSVSRRCETIAPMAVKRNACTGTGHERPHRARRTLSDPFENHHTQHTFTYISRPQLDFRLAFGACEGSLLRVSCYREVAIVSSGSTTPSLSTSSASAFSASLDSKTSKVSVSASASFAGCLSRGPLPPLLRGSLPLPARATSRMRLPPPRTCARKGSLPPRPSRRWPHPARGTPGSLASHPNSNTSAGALPRARQPGLREAR
mmetsp:Transcript_37933/g.65417  ORF Transcript_37933/g.65417 Transcript_37933/m.65417 type:complete len:247 (+) Transcript_37933:437-1177(+)